MSVKEVLSDHKQIRVAFPASTAVAIGDLLYNNSGVAAKASAQSDGGTEAANQETFAALFLGVAADARLSTETSTTPDSDRVVTTDGIFDITCPSTTWAIGDLVGPSEADSGTALENQQVEKVTVATRAIGYCVKAATSATTVRCRLISFYLPNVVYRGNLDASLADDVPLILGTGSDAYLMWSTADASNHATVLALGDTNEALHITDKAASASDWNVSADTDPTVYIHSNTTPITDYITIGAHDGTTAHINIAGGTTISVDIAGTASAHFDADGMGLADDVSLVLGTGSDAELLWSTGDASDHSVVLALGDTSQMLHITDLAARASDWNLTSPTHPTVYIHSNTTPITDYLLIGGHDGTTAGIDVVGGTTLDLRIAGTDIAVLTATALTLTAAASFAGQGSTIAGLMPAAAQQALSGAGAINVTTYYTAWTTTAADAGTLADGAQVGQLKKVQLIVDGGDGTLTPTNLAGGTTITFADAGDYALLMWNGTDWVAIELGNDADGATAPVLA